MYSVFFMLLSLTSYPAPHGGFTEKYFREYPSTPNEAPQPAPAQQRKRYLGFQRPEVAQ
jgi:hypothetical protein